MRLIDKIFLVIALLAIVNYFVTSYLFGDFGFNVGRFLLAIVGGWYIVSRGGYSLWFAASIGPFILLIDHVVLAGGHFLLEFLISTESADGSMFEAFLGVLVSFVIFSPVASMLSLISGISALLIKRLWQEA
jgi:hypothetical protein